MTTNAAAIEAAMDQIARAPFEMAAWSEVLVSLAAATGSQAAELLSWNNGQLPFHESWNFDEALVDQWVELGGADPNVNPMIRGGMACPVLGSVADHEVLPADARPGFELWADFHDRFDLPHICAGKAWTNGEQHLMLSAIRCKADGPIDDEQRAALHLIVRAAGGAARIAECIGLGAADTLARGLDALQSPAFVLDGFGRVMAWTERAEPLLRAGVLRVAGRRLVAANPAAQAQLQSAIRRITLQAALDPTMTVRVPLSGAKRTGAALRLVKLPRGGLDWGMGARALALVETVAGLDDLGLTAAEQAVAKALLTGARAPAIADLRGVSVETARTQIKAIYSKAQVANHAEFILRFAAAATN